NGIAGAKLLSVPQSSKGASKANGHNARTEAPGRDFGKSTEDDSTYIEFAPEFLSRDDPQREYLVPELAPAGVMTLFHGDPRARKSWAALDMAVAMATGTPAFGLERFTPAKPINVLYTSQEDSPFDVRLRAKALLKGRGIEQFPETLAFSV